MSGYQRVKQALTSIGKVDQYFSKFKENDMDDETVADCIADSDLTAQLNEIIPVVGIRLKFMKEFKKFGNEEVALSNSKISPAKKEEERIQDKALGGLKLNASTGRLEEELATSFSRNASIRSKEGGIECRGNVDGAITDSIKEFNLILNEHTPAEDSAPFSANETFLNDEELEKLFEHAERKASLKLQNLCGMSGPTFNNTISTCPTFSRFRESIKNAQSLFQLSNKLKRGKYEEIMMQEILASVQRYNREMKNLIENNFISPTQLNDFHSSISAHILNDFQNKKSKAKLYEPTKIKIIQQLEMELSNMKKLVQSTNDKITHQGRKFLDEALKNYRKNMGDYQGFSEDHLKKLHEDSKIPQIRFVEFSGQIPCNNAEFRSQLAKHLEKEIESSLPHFMSGLHTRRNKFQEALKKAKKAADSFYTKSMDDYFGIRSNFAAVAATSSTKTPKFYEAAALLIQHENTKKQVLKDFDTSIRGALKNSDDGDEEKNEVLDELDEEIQRKFENYKETNEMRENNFESRSRNFLAEAQNLYSSKIRAIIEEAFNESELTKKEQIIQKETFRFLHSKVDATVGRATFIKELDEELEDHMKAFFKDHLELFQMRQEEDEVAVRTALLNAKTYYNEQMEKHFVSSDFLEPKQLEKLNDKIMADSLRNCKEEIDLTADQERKLKEAMKTVYMKYVDRNILRLPMESPVVGIDLGTTYSCVGIYLDGRVKIIPNEYGNTTTPSYVAFQDDGSALVGDAAKDQSFRNPLNTIFDAKRLIGRKFSDPVVQKDMKIWPFQVVEDLGGGDEEERDRPKIKVGERTYHPEEISALVLQKMKKIAEDYLKKEVKDCVVTVPALFSDGQRQATKDAGRIAGLNVLKIINEPTAASIAYQLNRTDDLQRNVLIFDLGGGTFDVVVLAMTGGEIVVKAVHGDSHLGGEDFDGHMVVCCIEDFKKKNGLDLGRGSNALAGTERYNASSRLRRMKLECEKQKRILSTANATTIEVEMIDQGHSLQVPFTRSLFESLNAPQFQECIKIVQAALNEAGLSKSDVDDIVLVGGSTRIPKIQEMLTEFFDGKALSKQINPDEAVAYGAAIQAALISNQKVATGRFGNYGGRLRVQDVTPLSIGIELDDGSLNVLIPKNSPIPVTATKAYYKVYPEQTECLISIYEGEKLGTASDNNLLGEFTLLGIPKGQPYNEPIDVKMDVTDEGIMNVRAVIRSNQRSEQLAIITRKKRMTAEELDRARTAAAATR